MKSLILLTLVLAAMSLRQFPSDVRNDLRQQPITAQSPATQTANWQRYTYPGEEFSVELPAMPFIFDTVRTISTISRTEHEKVRVFGVYSEGVVFIVSSFDNPRPSESFDYLANFHWYGHGLSPTRAVTLDGFEGMEYEPTNSLHGLARIYLTKKRAYLVWAITTDENPPSVSRFMNSFTLGKKPSGKAIADYEPLPLSIPPMPKASAPDAKNAVAQPTPDTRPADGPFTQKEVTRKALLVYKPKPLFTEEARRGNIAGVVRLRAVLSSAGRVTNISVVKGLPAGLTEQAIEAARVILFFPAQKDGRVVSQYVTLEYNFDIY